MALVSNRLSDALTQKARSKLGIRFGRFAVAAIAAFLTTLVTLTICAGPLALTATWASLISWFSGALVSYVLSRWAWKRKGRPDLLRETVPFWIVSAMVVAILTVATKFGYHSAGWLHLHHAEPQHLARRHADEVRPVERDRPEARPQQPAYRRHQRGFPGPVRPDHAGDAALGHLEGNPAQDVPAAVADHQAFDREYRTSRGACPGSLRRTAGWRGHACSSGCGSSSARSSPR